MKYELVIFDSDGTLADTLPWMREVFNELAEQHGFRRVEPHEYDRFRDLYGRELLRALELPLWKLPRVINDMRRRMATRKEPFELFPGISEMLHRLSADGIRLAVVSSNSRANVERILGEANAAKINHWACGASVFGKATRLRGVLRTSRIAKSRALYIGDEIRDAIACRETGLSFGAVTWGQHSAATLRHQSPAELFDSPEQIVERLCT